MTSLDPNTLTVSLPFAFEQIQGTTISNRIQPLELRYSDNVISHKIAVVFVATSSGGLDYKHAAQTGEQFRTLFMDLLYFEDVKVFENVAEC